MRRIIGSVEKQKFKARIFLCLGSNVGERAEYLRRAGVSLGRSDSIRINRSSIVLSNPALIHTRQPDFLNQVLEIESCLNPYALLEFLKATEQNLGRVTRFRYGPREIDLDILAYGSERIDGDTLTLPHPGLFDRLFLRELLADLGETIESITNNRGKNHEKPVSETAIYS